MCFSAQVSLQAYVVGTVGCVTLAYLKEAYSEAIFFFYVLQMQLVEYFLWKHQPCDSVNKLVTKVGTLVNHGEPLVLWLAISVFSQRRLPRFVNAVMVIFLLETLYYNNTVLGSNCTEVTPESKPHLHWLWNEGPMSTLYYRSFVGVTTLLSTYGLEHGYTCATVNLCSYLVSYYVYNEWHAVGSMWCFSVAIDPYLLTILYSLY